MKRVINGVLLVLSVAAAVMPAFSIGGTQFGIIDLTEGVETYMLMCIDAMPVVLVILIPPVLAFIINLIRPIPARISAVVTSVLALAEAAMWIILEQYLSRLCKDYFSEYVDALNLTIFFFAIMIALAAVIMTSVLIMFTGDSKLRSDSAPAEELNTKKEQEICKDRTLPAKKPFRVRKIQKTVKISDDEDRIITPGRKTCREALLMALFGIAGVIIGAIIVLITVNSCVINRPYTSFQEYDQAIVDTGDAIPDEVVEVEPAKPAGTAEIEPAKTIEVDKADPAQTESTEDFEDYEAVEIEPATIATEEYDTEEYDHEYDNGCGYGYDNSYNDDSINIESRVQCIREMYNEIESRCAGYPCRESFNGIELYDNGSYQKLVIPAGIEGSVYEKRYYYMDYEPFFAFYREGSNEHRFYFCNGSLIKWIFNKTVLNKEENRQGWLDWETIVLDEANSLM